MPGIAASAVPDGAAFPVFEYTPFSKERKPTVSVMHRRNLIEKIAHRYQNLRAIFDSTFPQRGRLSAMGIFCRPGVV
jgi:hypothetical protein